MKDRVDIAGGLALMDPAETVLDIVYVCYY